MIRNIVLDMGMVLLCYDPMRACRRHAKTEDAALRIHAALFGAPEWREWLDQGTHSEEEFLALAQSRLETSSDKRLAAEVFADWDEDGISLIDGMSDLVAELLDRGFRLYVLSNAGTRFVKYQHKIPHVNRFSGVLYSAEERLLKPDTAIFDRLCECFMLKPEECLFVDDIAENVEGAEKAGMTGYLHQNMDVPRLRAYLQQLNGGETK